MKKVSSCHVEEVIRVVGGKWKLVILWHLGKSTLRFSELNKHIPSITQKMLAQSLRELEHDQLITRQVYSEIPPRVEYTLSKKGVSLGRVLQKLDQWGREHLPA